MDNATACEIARQCIEADAAASASIVRARIDNDEE